MSRPRVFVSSVVKDFKTFREAARRGIERGGGESILVNEDFPALGASSRNACLDAVDSADVYLVLIGARGGFKAPSGRLVVGEEYDHAKEKGLPVLAFLQDGEREDEAQRFADEISDYVSGHFRRTFASAEELEEEVRRAIVEMCAGLQNPELDMRDIQSRLEEPHVFQHEASIRAVFAPERVGEVIDPVTLGSKEFKESVLEIGHRKAVRLFSFERSKACGIDDEGFVVFQDEHYFGRGTHEPVRVEINEQGHITIDAAVTGRVHRGKDHSMLDHQVIAVEDVEEVLAASFRFCGAFFQQMDPYARYGSLFYALVLANVGSRTLERNPQDRNTFSMPMRDERPIRAFNEPRRIARQSLETPETEITRVVAFFERKLRSG